jgi:hypothetical protein
MIAQVNASRSMQFDVPKKAKGLDGCVARKTEKTVAMYNKRWVAGRPGLNCRLGFGVEELRTMDKFHPNLFPA